MQELLPVLIGIMLAGFVWTSRARVRAGHLVILGLLGGAVSTTINGEWAAGTAPFLFDTLTVSVSTGTILAVRAVVRWLRVKLLGAADGA